MERRPMIGLGKKFEEELSGWLEDLRVHVDALLELHEKMKNLESSRREKLEKSLGETATKNALTNTNEVPEESQVIAGNANGEDAVIQREKDIVVEEKVNEKFEDEIHEDEINPENDAVPKLQMNAFNLVHFNQHFEPTYRWVIDGLGKLIKDHPDNTKFATRSPEFAWTAYHPTIRSRAKLEFKEDGRVFVSLDIAESSKENLSRKNFKILPNIYYALRFKDENGAFPIHCCGFNSYHFHEEIDFAALNFWKKLNHDKSFFSEYCDDDEDSVVVIEIYVAPPAQMEKVYSYDGSLKNLAVRNLFDLLPKTEDTNSYGHDSIYLYTAPRGYRVQVCFEKSPKDIFRVVILFAVGEFDPELIKFFIHRTSVTLVHSSLNAEKNVTKAVEKFINIEKCSAYIINLCKWSNLRHFINDDGSLRFHLSIKGI